MKDYSIKRVRIVDEKKTTVILVDNVTGEEFVGEARRHPGDEFDYKIGVDLALERAAEALTAKRASVKAAAAAVAKTPLGLLIEALGGDLLTVLGLGFWL